MTDLESLQDKYIDLLEKEFGDISGIAYIHGYKPNETKVILGEFLRNEIKKLKKDDKGRL